MEKYGVFGICALRSSLQRNDSVSTSILLDAMRSIGVELSKSDALQVRAVWYHFIWCADPSFLLSVYLFVYDCFVLGDRSRRI